MRLLRRLGKGWIGRYSALEKSAKVWAEKVVNNMSRSPQGNDRDQIKAVVAGEGDIAIVNTYYIGKLLNSKNINQTD